MKPTKSQTMLEIAAVLSKRASCMIRKVGCVITDKNGNILSTGYNGSARGQPDCDGAHYVCPAAIDQGKSSCKSIHAEMNALLRCPDVEKIHTVYITEAPCPKCLELIMNTSAQHIAYDDIVITLHKE